MDLALTLMAHPGKIIARLRSERGWDQEELSRRSGVSRASISLHENERKLPTYRVRKLYAKAFDMPIDEFERAWRSSRVPLSQGDPDGGIPIINRAPAGGVVDYEEYGPDSGIGYDYIKRYDITEETAFGVQVVGDSMAPTLSEGDEVIFVPLDRSQPIEAQIGDGTIVFVRFADDSPKPGCSLVRLYIEDGQVVLRKDNPAYPPIRAAGEELSQVAKAIEFRRKLRQPPVKG